MDFLTVTADYNDFQAVVLVEMERSKSSSSDTPKREIFDI